MKVKVKIANLSNSNLSKMYRALRLIECTGVLCDNCPFFVNTKGCERCIITLLEDEVWKRRQEGQNV